MRRTAVMGWATAIQDLQPTASLQEKFTATREIGDTTRGRSAKSEREVEPLNSNTASMQGRVISAKSDSNSRVTMQQITSSIRSAESDSNTGGRTT